jgi:hypothetical protein
MYTAGSPDEAEARAGGLTFAYCYFCSTNGLCLEISTGTGRRKCTPRSGSNPCRLSGAECSVALYRDNIIANGRYKDMHIDNSAVSGTVLDESGRPVAGYEARLFLPNGQELTGKTDNDGRFTISVGDATANRHSVNVGSIHIGGERANNFVSVFAYPD